MWQDFVIGLCGVWIAGGLILIYISPKTHFIGLAALIGGIVGLAISLSY